MSRKLNIINKHDPGIAYIGNWSLSTGGIAVYLNDVYNSSNLGTSGYFCLPDYVLADVAGTSATPLKEGIHFEYDKRLDASISEDSIDGFGHVPGGIYDTGHSGEFAEGKCLRLVHGVYNIVYNGSGGLNLKVYAKNLAVESTPPYDRIYIDPIRKKYILPRPIYWNRMLSDVNLNNPQIAIPGYTSSFYEYARGGWRNNSGKFGYGVQEVISGWDNLRYLHLYSGPINSKGCASIWLYGTRDTDSCDFRTEIVIGNISLVQYNGPQGQFWDIYISSSYLYRYNVNLSGSRYYLYVVWDSANGLSGGASLKIYINTTLIYQTTGVYTFSGDTRFTVVTYANPDGGTSISEMSNPKVWGEVVSETPDWDYNGGTGRENSMHSIYPSSNDYEPLTIKCGFCMIQSSDSPVALLAPGPNTEVELESAANYANGAGYFGVAPPLKNSSYENLEEDEDYVYDTPLDGSGLSIKDIWDDNSSGPLDPGKYMRIVQANKSVTDPTGLGLTPIAKDLTTSLNPPPTQVYVDPVKGKFILPRPLFWSKCESPTNILSPEIGFGTPSMSDSGTPVTQNTSDPERPGFGYWQSATGKFNNAIQYYRAFPMGGYYWATDWGLRTISLLQTPFNFRKGSISFWNYGYIYGGVYDPDHVFSHGRVSLWVGILGLVEIYITAHDYPGYAYDVSASLNINGSSVGSSGYSQSTFYHYYLIWDCDKGLPGGKSVILYRNNTEIASTTSTLPTQLASTIPGMRFEHTGSAYTNMGGYFVHYARGEMRVDNLKIWNRIVSEDPSFEYNGGAGREDALDLIYGESSGYKPTILSASNGGVGYYKPGGSGSYLEWNV